MLEQIDLPEGQWRKDATGYYPAVRVVFEVPPRGLTVLRGAPAAEANTTQWEEVRLTDTDIDLRYIVFFDFANRDDPWDFRYVRVRVVSTRREELVGKDLLIEATDVSYEQLKV